MSSQSGSGAKVLKLLLFNVKVFDRGPDGRCWWTELSTQSPQDSPLLRDTPKTSRPKDEGKRKEQEQKQKLERERERHEEGTKKVRGLEAQSRYVSNTQVSGRQKEKFTVQGHLIISEK